MIPGLNGRLISGDFLEGELAEERVDSPFASVEATRLDLQRWRAACAWLGPAASLRTLLESAAAPLVTVLGFPSPVRIEAVGNCLVATLSTSSQPILLLVVS